MENLSGSISGLSASVQASEAPLRDAETGDALPILTCFLVCIPGGGKAPYATSDIQGIPMQYKASLSDMYQACAAVMKDCQAIENAARFTESFKQSQMMKPVPLSSLSAKERKQFLGK